MIQVGQHLSVNPQAVASLKLDTRHYFSGPGNTVLIIRMVDGYEHWVEHTAGYLDGVDVYKVKRAIEAALAGEAER